MNWPPGPQYLLGKEASPIQKFGSAMAGKAPSFQRWLRFSCMRSDRIGTWFKPRIKEFVLLGHVHQGMAWHGYKNYGTVDV